MKHLQWTLVPNGFSCPITTELMCDPVIIEGISFERSSAESWLRDHDTHPSTGVRLVSKVYLIFNYVSLISNRSFLHSSHVLTPNINLRQAIDECKKTQVGLDWAQVIPVPRFENMRKETVSGMRMYVDTDGMEFPR